MHGRRAAKPLRADHVEPLIAAHCWPDAPRVRRPGAIGIETETFAIRMASDGKPAGRARLNDLARYLDDYAPQHTGVRGPPLRWDMEDGGVVTLEPGGQLEYSSRPTDTAAAALEETERHLAGLVQALAAHGVGSVSVGMDLWHDLAGVPQQLPAARYGAMDAYFSARGGADGPGAMMMRHTCSLQVNLDLGSAAVAPERWLVANLVAPLLTSTFACSPTGEAVSGRALVWQALDPTRTGFPNLERDPVAALAQAALRADVLCFRVGATMAPGLPGFTFGDWLREGHPEHGRPAADDLTYHLTTLWPEVRVRGFLEFRSIDALPSRWRAVPVVLLSGLLYDDRARTGVRAVLERHRADLPALTRRAAQVGPQDPQLCAMSVETWSLALAGAARLPRGWLRPEDLAVTEAFLDRFTLRGRCPADELREHLASDPALALAWARQLDQFSSC